MHVNFNRRGIKNERSGTNKAKSRPPRLAAPGDVALRLALLAFKRLLRQTQVRLALKKADACFYDRIFTPVVTLWYMIFQRLNSDHTLQAAVVDLHRGGADRLSPGGRPPLSKRITSVATTAFSRARARLPLALFPAILSAQAQDIWREARDCQWLGLRVLLLDGSQLALRPHPGVVDRFEPSANQNGKAYWVLMRVVATFCLHTGIVVASATGAASVPEQSLACRQILLAGLKGCLYLGDRNFGIFWVVQSVLEAHAQCLFRLTTSRAGKLVGTRRLRRCGDYPITWCPSAADLRRPQCRPHALNGRLIVAQYSHPGFQTRWIYLFTTLTDSEAYSAQQLLELYAARWQIELDLRYLKTQMNLAQLECKSADMAEKEWMAGLMAYNLVRALMMTAALRKGLNPALLSFSATRRLLLRWLQDATTWRRLSASWPNLLKSVAASRLPSRLRPRPHEPRAKRYKRETFPPLCGSRTIARTNLQNYTAKS